MLQHEIIKLENGKDVLVAKYLKQQLIDYSGNPLIEALPPILSFEEAFDQLSYLPEFYPSERNLSSHFRFHSILRLTRFFQPVGQTLDLEQRFSRFIRFGYVNRNPFQKQHVQTLNELHFKLSNKQDIGLPPDLRVTASSFTLMGFSGIGKTSAIERILSLYPQVILHKKPLNTLQIVWLKLNCPFDGSLKSLCMDFFQKIDLLIGTNYYEKYGKTSMSISSMVTRMGQLSRLHCVGALIIDEIQHLLSVKGEASEKMMNFFVTLVNEIGIPVMMIGTMKAKSILQRDFRQARRGSGQGDMVWQQMEQGDDWEVLMASLWDYQWTKEYVELNDYLQNVMYEESQGIIDIAVKLFILAQIRAIETGLEKITPNLIKQVSKDDLKLVQPMLAALKSGRGSEIAKYEDIIPMDLQEYIFNKMSILNMKERIQEKKEKISKDRQKKEISNLEKLIMSLINLDIDEKLAEKVANSVIKKHPNFSLPELLSETLKTIGNISEDRRKNKQLVEISDNLLNSIIELGKKKRVSGYEALLEKSYIKNPLKEFIL